MQGFDYEIIFFDEDSAKLIKNNNIAGASFIKKQEWGPAKLYIKNVKFENNSKKFLLGKTSELKVNNNFFSTRKKDKTIYKIIYSNQ